jgi:hypothetical protein
MMLVGDAPGAVDPAQSNRQPELKDILRRAAPHDCDGEGDVVAGRDFDVLDIEGVRRLVASEEEIPRLAVFIQSARLKRGRDVEHDDMLIVVGENARIVVPADGIRPGVDQFSDFSFGGLILLRHDVRSDNWPWCSEDEWEETYPTCASIFFGSSQKTVG